MEIITAAILGFTASTLTFERVEAAPIPFQALQIIEPAKPLPLPEYAKAKAEEYDISWEKLNNLITYESSWDPTAHEGQDRGIVQINSYWHPEVTDEQAFDPYWAIDWAAKEISEGREHAWVVCNCYLLVKSKLGDALPLTKDLHPNSVPMKGAVAIFNYSGTPHYAYVYEVTETTVKLFESNFEPCKVGFREISRHDPHLEGFFFPG